MQTLAQFLYNGKPGLKVYVTGRITSSTKDVGFRIEVGCSVVAPSLQVCIPLSYQLGTIFGFESLDYEMTSSH
jgi:hypothetical protein